MPLEVKSEAHQPAVVDVSLQASNTWKLTEPLGARAVEAI
jgi:hypothetical protein